MRRLGLAAIVVTFGFSIGWPTAAFAAAYDPNAIGITTSSACATPAGTLTVNGSNFAANESVTVTLNGSPVGSTTTNSQNSFSTTVTIPSGTATGTSYAIVATGSVGDSSRTNVTVSTSCAPSGLALTPATTSGLAFTGADIAAVSTVGAIAITVGGMLILAGRRRRTTGG